MATIYVLGDRGDTRTFWDVKAAEAGDLREADAVAAAEAIFKKEVKEKGCMAFKVEPGVPAERIVEFDPKAEEIMIIPRMSGG